MILGVRHVGFGYDSIAEVENFYEKILGFRKIWHKDESGSYIEKLWGVKVVSLTTMKFEAPDGSVIEGIHKIPRLSHINFNHIALITDDIEGECKRLQDRVHFVSLPVEAPDGNSKVAIFVDPAGNSIELVEILKEWK